MNGIWIESTVVKEYGFFEPLNHKIDSIIDTCMRDSPIRYFHTFECKVHMILNSQTLEKMK